MTGKTDAPAVPATDEAESQVTEPAVLDDDASYEKAFAEQVAKREAEKTGDSPKDTNTEPPAADKAAAEPKKEEQEKKTDPTLSDDELLALVPEDRRDAVRARLDAERDTIERLDHANRANAGRVSAYQKRYEVAAGIRPAEAAKAATAEQLDDWTNIEKDYPELAKGIKQLFETKGGNPTDLKSLVDYVETEKRERYLNDAYDAVETVHPGWREVAKQKPFQDWLKTSPTYERLASSNEVADAVALFDLWNVNAGREAPAPDPEQAAEAGKLAARREAQTRGAQAPRGRAASPNQDVDLTDEDQMFAFYANKANQRMRDRFR